MSKTSKRDYTGREIFTMFQDISLKILSNDKLKILFIETGIANIYDRKKES